jgi:Fe-S-cluster containining protein
MTGEPWYQDGLKFTCTQCGNCCTGGPGFTWVSEDEIARLAARLGVDDATFRKRYTKTVWRGGEKRVSLLENKRLDCVFFTREHGCSVYSDRPKQCRTWPFWERIVETPEDWHAEKRGCPGMDHGTLHSAAHIAATAADDGL